MEFTRENLLELLEFCTQSIRDGKMDETTQERVWNALTFDKNDPDNANMIKYLFTGWCVHQLKNAQDATDSVSNKCADGV